MGTIWHHTSSLQFFPMDKGKRHWEEIYNPLPWLSHLMVYSLGWGETVCLSFCTMDWDGKLPPFMMREHTFPLPVHRVWKIASICLKSSRVGKPLKAPLIASTSPSSRPSSTSSGCRSNTTYLLLPPPLIAPQRKHGTQPKKQPFYLVIRTQYV